MGHLDRSGLAVELARLCETWKRFLSVLTMICLADDEVPVARRNGRVDAMKDQSEEHMQQQAMEHEATPSAAEVAAQAAAQAAAQVAAQVAAQAAAHAAEAVEEQQPLAARAAQQNHEARARGSRANGARATPADDEEFMDAGAVDNGEDSDASEMSNEMKGDHDVNIEEFDKPVMMQSVEAAAVKAGVPTRKGTPSAKQHSALMRRAAAQMEHQSNLQVLYFHV